MRYGEALPDAPTVFVQLGRKDVEFGPGRHARGELDPVKSRSP